jgi:hypothetical protein
MKPKALAATIALLSLAAIFVTAVKTAQATEATCIQADLPENPQ